MLTASKSCCKFTIFEVSGCLSLSLYLSHILQLSLCLLCILFFIPLGFFAFVCILRCFCCVFFVLSPKFSHCMLRTVTTSALSPTRRVSVRFRFTLPTSRRNKSLPYSAYTLIRLCDFCFQLSTLFLFYFFFFFFISFPQAHCNSCV